MQQAARGVGPIHREFPVAVSARRRRVAEGPRVGMPFDDDPVRHSPQLRAQRLQQTPARIRGTRTTGNEEQSPLGLQQVDTQPLTRNANLYVILDQLEFRNSMQRLLD